MEKELPEVQAAVERIVKKVLELEQEYLHQSAPKIINDVLGIVKEEAKLETAENKA